MAIHLRTLGTVDLASDNGDASAAAIPQAKRIALLVYLVLARPRGTHRRDSLVAMFWPELDGPRGRSALRQALHAIRRATGTEAVSSIGLESIEVARDAVTCDVLELERSADAGDHEIALAHYGGEFLAGLHVTDAPAFMDWVDTERRRIASRVCANAWVVAESARADGRATDAIRAIRLARSLAEYDEDGLRRGMHLLSELGERGEALDMYERFAVRLRGEFDAEPSSESRALADDVRRRDRGPSRAFVAPSSPPVNTPTARRVLHRHPWRFARVAAAAVAMLGLVSLRSPTERVFDPRRVQVAGFVNETDVPALDTVARVASMMAREALVRLDNIQVLASDGNDPLDVFTQDRSGHTRDDAGTTVRGRISAAGDSVELRTEIITRATGAIARAIVAKVPRNIGAASFRTALLSLADQVSAAVATALYPGWGNALSQPLSYAGYRLFIDGMRSIKLERHDDALAAFSRAYANDSTFVVAGLLAAMEHYQLRNYRIADSIAQSIEPRATTLAPIDRRLLEWLQHSLRGNRTAARASMMEIVRLAPTADLAWLQLAIDNVETARPGEALAALSHIAPESDFGEGWASFWATRLEALHLRGDHQSELVAARDGLARHPELTILRNYELRALAALGDTDAVDQRIRTFMTLSASVNPASTIRQAALELRAHGHSAAAAAALERALRWYDERSASERTTLGYQTGRARTLYLMDKRPEARAIYDSLARAYPRCLDCLGVLGVLAARDGRRATADSSLSQLKAAEGPYMLGRNLMWAARIALTLGDTARATSLADAAFASGVEFDVMTHADPDLLPIRPDSIYRALWQGEPRARAVRQ